MAPRRVEDVAGHGVELGGWSPRGERRPGLPRASRPPPVPARRILASSAALRLTRQADPAVRRSSMARTTRLVTWSGDPTPLTLDQELALRVPVDQRRRLALVELEAAADGLLGVVLPLDHLAAADVAGPVEHAAGPRPSSWCRSPRRPGGRPGAAAPGASGTSRSMTRSSWSGARRSSRVSAWAMVRGQPSRMKPRARVSPSVRRSPTISMMRSSGSSSPRSMTASGPLAERRCWTSPRPAACRRWRRGAPRSGATGARTASPCRPPACRGPRVLPRVPPGPYLRNPS